MAKPWERFQQQPEETKKPWEKFIAQEVLPEGELLIQPGEAVPQGYETYHDPELGTIARQVKEEPSIGEKIVGAGETALTLGTAATGGTAGHVIGTLQGLYESLSSGKYGTQEGAELVKKAAEDLSSQFTYTPRTETGKEYVQETAEALAPLEALTPAAIEMGAVARTMRPAVGKAVTKITEPIKEEIDLVKAAIPEAEKTKQLRITMKENPTNKEVAKYKIVKDTAGAERVVSDDIAKEAMKQGFEDRVISTIKSGSDVDRKKMLSMLNIHKMGKKSADFAAKNRPADIVGKSIEDRVSFLAKTKKEAGKEIETTANALKGKTVYYDPAINKFMHDLDDIGVKVIPDEKGKLKIDLKGSDIEGDVASKQLLKTIFTRLVDTKVPDAYDVHRAKRFIDTQVSYGKQKANPLSRTTENIVKSLRRNLNDTLGEYSTEYKDANTKYSNMIDALDEIQRAVGTRLDFDSPNAAKQFGTASRKLLSNYGSRVQMMDAIDNLDKMSKQYGMKIDDDIIKQVIFANEVDRMFGSPAATSFKGQIEQAIEKGTEAARRGVVDAALDMAKSGIEKARGINEENAIKSMEELLKSNIKKEQ